jgi:indole-3-glycerol phosphate synthase
MTILDEIRAHKVDELAARERRRGLDDVVAACASAPRGRRFRDALLAGAAADGLALIAEVKRKSPAAGALRPDADAAILGSSYVEAGASAVSVLTDEKYFAGTDADLAALRRQVDAPLLRKDFTIGPYQIYEARALGADAILLILAMLSDPEITACLAVAVDLGLDVVVEAHTAEEVARGLALGASIIGINNRDLATFTTDLGTTERLRPLIPPEVVVIAESGISSRADVQRMLAAGAQAVLVGEALVRAADPAARVRELLGRAVPV